MRLLISVLFIMLSAPAVLQSQDKAPTEADVKAYVNRLMDLEVKFENMVPPGLSITSKEYSRNGESGKNLVVRYHIFIKGIPEGTIVKAMQWPVNQEKPSVLMEGVSVGKNGLLTCAGRRPDQCGDPSNPDDPIEFTFAPVKGEPSRVAFIAGDKTIGIVLNPDPVEAKDRSCSLSAVRLTNKFELAFISGSGYRPNTDVHYKFSTTKSKEDIVKSDPGGTIRISVISPVGKGTAKFKVNEPNCSPELTFDYGTP